MTQSATHRWAHSMGLRKAHAVNIGGKYGMALCGVSRAPPWELSEPLSPHCAACERIAEKRKVWVK